MQEPAATEDEEMKEERRLSPEQFREVWNLGAALIGASQGQAKPGSLAWETDRAIDRAIDLWVALQEKLSSEAGWRLSGTRLLKRDPETGEIVVFSTETNPIEDVTRTLNAILDTDF